MRNWRQIEIRDDRLFDAVSCDAGLWLICDTACYLVSTKGRDRKISFGQDRILAANTTPSGNLFLYTTGGAYLVRPGGEASPVRCRIVDEKGNVKDTLSQVVAVSQHLHRGIGDVYACVVEEERMYLYRAALGEIKAGRQYAIYCDNVGTIEIVSGDRVVRVLGGLPMGPIDMFVGDEVVGVVYYRSLVLVAGNELVVFPDSIGGVEADGNLVVVCQLPAPSLVLLDTASGKWTKMPLPIAAEDVLRAYVSASLIAVRDDDYVWVTNTPPLTDGDWRNDCPVKYSVTLIP